MNVFLLSSSNSKFWIDALLFFLFSSSVRFSRRITFADGSTENNGQKVCVFLTLIVKCIDKHTHNHMRWNRVYGRVQYQIIYSKKVYPTFSGITNRNKSLLCMRVVSTYIFSFSLSLSIALLFRFCLCACVLAGVICVINFFFSSLFLSLFFTFFSNVDEIIFYYS